MSQDASTVSTTGKEPLSREDPEVKVKPERVQFTAEYKLRILKEADNCTGPGQIGALLRWEWLYSSNLTQWRLQRAEGLLQDLTPQEAQEEVRSEGRSTHQEDHCPPFSLCQRLSGSTSQNRFWRDSRKAFFGSQNFSSKCLKPFDTFRRESSQRVDA